MNSAWSRVKGKIGAGRAKEFFLSIRESWEECEKTNAKVGGVGGGASVAAGAKAPQIAVKWRNRCREVERALWLVKVNTPGY